MSQIDERQMLTMGTVLDHRYRIVRYLASGGFGNTYVAEDTRLGGQMAVKEFFMRSTNHRSTDGTTVEVSNDTNAPVFQTQLKKFQREARRIFELQNDHIIQVTDLFDANGTSYYVMKLINGSSLAKQKLPEQEALDVILQVLDALEAMHKAGLYHLDVKPGNIMREANGHCTLIDFGASKQLTTDERNTLSSSSMAYTPGYAPLEQMAQQSQDIGPWTYFFALGATLYCLVTGTPPPQVSVTDFAPNGRQFPYPATVSANIRHAVAALMNPIHTLRPQTAAEVRTLLGGTYRPKEPPIPKENPQPEETVLDHPSPDPTDEKTRLTSPTHQTPRRKGLRYAVAGITAVILLLGFLVLIADVIKEDSIKAEDDKQKEDTTKPPISYKECPDDNHPHMIDLGLLSGTKWACCNVDASTPEDDGGYYAWGETTTKSNYSWETYKHCDGTAETCRNIGESICGTQYDVAHVKWGEAWQMPTLDQVDELLDKCKSEWTTVNGVSGRRFTGPNGGSIFLPASGYRSGTDLNDRGKSGDYWSGTLGTYDDYYAYSLSFFSGNAGWGNDYRRDGFTVRPVAE